jgi:hypothetical protein
LDVIGTKEFTTLLHVFTVTSTNGYYSAPPSKSNLKLVCNINIVYGSLKFENSQDYAQKPRRKCMFMNSVSGNTLMFGKEVALTCRDLQEQEIGTLGDRTQSDGRDHRSG